MPIDASPSGTLDIENATLRSREIVALTSMVTGNDVVRSSNPPTLEVYGDPSYGVIEPRLELVSNTSDTNSNSFTRLTSNVGVFSIKTGTDASDNGTITFGGFANERMRITSDGNVGIGLTNPVDVTHIFKDGGDDVYGLLIQQANSGTGSAALRFSTNTTGENATAFSKAGIMFQRTATNGRGDLLFCIDNVDDTNDVGVADAALTIRGDGNVGIGTTDPQTHLHIHDNSTDNVQLTIQNINQSGRSGILFMNSANDEFKIQHVGGLTANSNTAVIENFSTVNGGIRFYAKGDGDYKFRTTNNNNERMRIANDGKVSIGGITPLTTLDVNGVMQSFAGKHVKTVPVRHNTYTDIAANGDYIRIGTVALGSGASYSGSYCAFDWFGSHSIKNFSEDRWVTPNRLRVCFKWGFVAGYIGNVTFKIWETLYTTSDTLKATITSSNGSLSRGFTTVWGPEMTMIYNDVPSIKIEADSNNTENSGATIRISDVWLEYSYEP